MQPASGTETSDRGLSSFALKVIALVAMTLDHAASVIGIFYGYGIGSFMNAVGRMAFPLFAFLIAEGASHTRSMPKYIGRLLLFTLISEPFHYFAQWILIDDPRILSFGGLLRHLAALKFGSIFPTLALGAITIYVWQLLEKRGSKKWLLLSIPTVLCACLLSGWMDTDYRMSGVLLIIFLYIAPKRWMQTLVIVIWSVCVYLIDILMTADPNTIISFAIFRSACAALAGVLILFYNGKRGKKLKWFFYIYYPAHLFVFTLLHIAVHGLPNV